jgi:hypothetical protein
MNLNNNTTYKKENQSKLNSHLNSQDLVNFIDNVLANSNGIVTFFKKHKDDRQRQRLAEQQRDEAIKAINSKNREINYLARQLVEGRYLENKKTEYYKWRLYEPHTWTPARNISWLKDFFNMDQRGLFRGIGKILSNKFRRSGLEPRQIIHPELGTINIYHKVAIQDFHDTVIKDPNFMKKFRKQ